MPPSALHVLSSGESSGEASSDSCDEALGADAETLRLALREARARVSRLQQESGDPDVVLGGALLSRRKERRVAQAYADHAMSERRARAVFEHARDRARQRFSRRCEKLKEAMDEELARELQRLQNAKAGVSVSNRRRRGVRPASGADAALLVPPTVEADASKLQRQLDEAATVSCYYYDGAAFPLPATASDELVDSEPDEDAAAMSPADLVKRARHREKKQLDALLARPKVFPQLHQKLKPSDVREDLAMIQNALQLKDQSATEANSEDEKRAQQMRHPTYAGRRGGKPQAPKVDAPAAGSGVEVHAETKSPRRILNPQILVEGQEVVVYRRSRSGTMPTAADDDKGEMECILSGVIAATTSTHAFVLGPSGQFESFAVDAWARGQIVIRAPDLTRRRKQSRHIIQ